MPFTVTVVPQPSQRRAPVLATPAGHPSPVPPVPEITPAPVVEPSGTAAPDLRPARRTPARLLSAAIILAWSGLLIWLVVAFGADVDGLLLYGAVSALVALPFSVTHTVRTVREYRALVASTSPAAADVPAA